MQTTEFVVYHKQKSIFVLENLHQRINNKIVSLYEENENTIK